MFKPIGTIEGLSSEEGARAYNSLLSQYNLIAQELKRERKTVKFLTAAIENIPNSIIVKDEGGNIFACSDELGEMFGKNTKLIVGRTSLEMDYFFNREECSQFQEEDYDLLSEGGVLHYEKEFTFADGEMHPCFYWSKGFEVHDDEGPIRGIVSEFVDMTKEKQLEADLEYASQIDHGTGLFNRYVFDAQTKDIINNAIETGAPVSVMICDLDHFKRVNDTFGHLEGDRVLKDFANIIKAETRSVDVPIRYGGEEFLIFLPDTDLPRGQVVAERLREVCEDTMELPDGSHITVSIGLVKFDVNESRQQCIERADEALYTAKETGRNKVVVFASESEKFLG